MPTSGKRVSQLDLVQRTSLLSYHDRLYPYSYDRIELIIFSPSGFQYTSVDKQRLQHKDIR